MEEILRGRWGEKIGIPSQRREDENETVERRYCKRMWKKRGGIERLIPRSGYSIVDENVE